MSQLFPVALTEVVGSLLSNAVTDYLTFKLPRPRYSRFFELVFVS